MDALSSLLEIIKIKSAVYFKADFSSPWGMSISTSDVAQFHMVVKGKCLLKINQEETVKLHAGDIVIFPTGDAHWLADSENSKKEDGLHVVTSIQQNKPIFKGEHFATTLICGHFEFDKNLDPFFLKSLPSFIHITGIKQKEFTWLETITNLIMSESDTGLLGKSIAVNKLAEVLFIHSIRAYILQNTEKTGFFAALKNPKLSRVLKSIHKNPQYRWNLENLAKEAGMSRTLFANKFRDIVGETPHHYITNWRIVKAKKYLKESTVSIAEIAERVGYSSEAAFNRTFKKKVQKTPALYRRIGN